MIEDDELIEVMEADVDDEMVATQNWNLQPFEHQLDRDCWNCPFKRTCGGNCNFDDIP